MPMGPSTTPCAPSSRFGLLVLVRKLVFLCTQQTRLLRKSAARPGLGMWSCSKTTKASATQSATTSRKLRADLRQEALRVHVQFTHSLWRPELLPGCNRRYNVIHAAAAAPANLPLAGQFVSTLFCVGHVKSTASDDESFFDEFTPSQKWLQMHSGI